MTYLDYSATTPIDNEVLKTYVKASEFIGNPNSLHKLGTDAKHLIDASTKQIAEILNVKPEEIIYTSGASEANNLAIKGIDCYQNREKHIITTRLEHSSIYSPLKQMEKKGYKISYVPLINGIIDIGALDKLLSEDTVLVSIGAVNSETGIMQPIEKIGKLLKKYPKVIFHSDMTQAIGKIKVNLDDVDLISFSAHKFFGPKGIGALIKKENIKLTPLISGGKSTTVYRSGTPATSLIAAMAKALRLVYENLEEEKVLKLNNILKENLCKYENVYINSNEFSIPHILNFSTSFIKPETLMHALEEDDIYISTQSACATNDISSAIFAITEDEVKARGSVRISISKKTTEDEIKTFIDSFDKIYRRFS